MTKTTLRSEIWALMRANKKYWLVPIVAMLVLFVVILLLTKGSAGEPFVYTLF